MWHQCQMPFSGGTLQDRKNQRHYSPYEGTKISPPLCCEWHVPWRYNQHAGDANEQCLVKSNYLWSI